MALLLIPITILLLLVIFNYGNISSYLKKKKRYVWIIIISIIAIIFFIKGMAIPAFVMSMLAAMIPIIRSLVIGIIYNKIMDKIYKKEYKYDLNRKNDNFSQNMGKEEALKIMGLDNNYDKEELIKRYHYMMKNNHPDKGGSEYIATQIITAKDILLNELQKDKDNN